MSSTHIDTLTDMLSSATPSVRDAVTNAIGNGSVEHPGHACSWYAEISDTTVVWLASPSRLTRVEVYDDGRLFDVTLGMSKVGRLVVERTPTATVTIEVNVDNNIVRKASPNLDTPGADQAVAFTTHPIVYTLTTPQGSPFAEQLNEFVMFLRLHLS
jgi:hypothetical protein